MLDMPTRQLPAEWVPQDGVMLTWPHDKTAWAPYLDSVERVYLDLAQAIAKFETLLIVCRDDTHRALVMDRLRTRKITQACFAIAASNDTWARDHGPICIHVHGQPLLLDFKFNGWGGKFPYHLDNDINAHLAVSGCFAAKLEAINFILEGGAIDTDGEGTLLTTRHCLLAPTRNPGLNEHQIESHLRAWLGVQRILWLTHGELAGDDTDGHVDTLARFCDTGTIAYTSCNDRDDPQYDELLRMAEELRALKQQNGKPYRLLSLPLPRAHYDAEGQRLPATYANFLIINKAVLVPIYNDPAADRCALSTLSQAFPNRTIIGIDCVPLIQQYGSLHCITMQLPAGCLADHNISTCSNNQTTLNRLSF